MSRLFHLLALLLILFLPLEARDKATVVWNNPCADKNLHNHDGYFRSTITPVRVEFGQDTTILTMEVRFRPGFWFILPSDTHLMADGKRYDIIGSEGIDLDSKTVCGQDGIRKFKLYFRPLPSGIGKFDFRETDTDDAGAFNIMGITDPRLSAGYILPTTWRDDNSGEWLVGFFDEGVVYDSGFWNYHGTQRPTVKSSEFKITDGKEILPVKVGKLKNGVRKISIGDNRYVCSMITGRTLPDYPVRDDRPEFIDNGYSRIDTAIVRGWLKDSPEIIKQYDISVEDMVTDESNETMCIVDSLGRFELKVPLVNSSECFMDWKNTFIRTVLEPGKTYYLLYDFGRGQKLFMGEDCRVQNELLAYPPEWHGVPEKAGADAYLAAVDSALSSEKNNMEDLVRFHPSLSDRFRHYKLGHVGSVLLSQLGQSRFSMPDRRLTDNTVDYLSKAIGDERYKPYSLHRDFFTLLRDLVEDQTSKNDTDISFTPDKLVELSEEAELPDEEIAVIYRFRRLQNEFEEISRSGLDSATVAMRIEMLQSRNSALIDSVNQILNGNRIRNVIMSHSVLTEMNSGLAFLDSCGADDALRSIWLSRKGYDAIDNLRQSMSPENQRFLTDNIHKQVMLDMVMAENDKYLALERRINGAAVPVVRNISVADGNSAGAALLDSITSPHRGKLILLDVWGSWCGPCRAALSKSQEEYAELAPYDIVYVYLANSTPDNAWRNVIEEYDVKGENCYHYNLPAEQQNMIESVLKVNKYPSYRLFDREGNLLDVNADPRDINALKKVLEMLK